MMAVCAAKAAAIRDGRSPMYSTRSPSFFNDASTRSSDDPSPFPRKRSRNVWWKKQIKIM
jgi:hypothetical protein